MYSKQIFSTLNPTPQGLARNLGGKPICKLVSRGLAECIQECKAHGYIYIAYVLHNICHACLHLFTYISSKVVSSYVQGVGGFCFSIPPFRILS